MSYKPTADSVRNVLEFETFGDLGHTFRDVLSAVDDTRTRPTADFGGWTVQLAPGDLGLHRRLFGFQLTRGANTVFLVVAGPEEEETFVIFSDDPGAVREFYYDFEKHLPRGSEIEDHDTVMQWS